MAAAARAAPAADVTACSEPIGGRRRPRWHGHFACRHLHDGRGSRHARHGRRPSYIAAERPEKAKPLFETVKAYMRESGVAVESGTFMADMQVSLVNDGPFTILLNSKKEF